MTSEPLLSYIRSMEIANTVDRLTIFPRLGFPSEEAMLPPPAWTRNPRISYALRISTASPSSWLQAYTGQEDPRVCECGLKIEIPGLKNEHYSQSRGLKRLYCGPILLMILPNVMKIAPTKGVGATMVQITLRVTVREGRRKSCEDLLLDNIWSLVQRRIE